MDTPKFNDVSKKSTHILDGFYDTGNFLMNLKCKENGNEFLFSSQIDQNCKMTLGSKTEISSEYGVQIQKKWNSDNILFTELAFKNCLCDGSRLGFTGSVMPQNGQLAGAVNCLIRRDNLRWDMSILNEQNQSKCHNELVLRLKEYFIGGQFRGKCSLNEIAQDRNFLLGYGDDKLEMNVLTKNFKDLNLNIFQKMNETLEMATRMVFNGQQTVMELGCKLQWSQEQLLVKVDTNAQIGLGFSKKLNNFLEAKLWTKIDGKKIKQPDGHKMGVGLIFEF